jgi:hypothetical protein
MKKRILELLMEHDGYFGNVITRDLPTKLDNSLYTLVHFLGEMELDDVRNFAKKATAEQIEYLSELVSKFPSQQHELMVNVGGFEELRNSDSYTEILEFIRDIGDENLISEAGTHQELRLGDIPNSEKWITPEMKKVLFKQWDKVGHADWKILKFVGLEMGNMDSHFDNVLDVIYPILRIEWEGGIKGTEAWDDGQQWGHMFHDGSGSDQITDFEYRIMPVGYDFLMDESESYGEHGYSCWNIFVEFRPSSKRSPMLWEGLEIGVEIFEEKNYPLDSYRSYGNEEFDLLEHLWEDNDRIFGDYFNQFCEVEVKVH